MVLAAMFHGGFGWRHTKILGCIQSCAPLKGCPFCFARPSVWMHRRQHPAEHWPVPSAVDFNSSEVCYHTNREMSQAPDPASL